MYVRFYKYTIHHQDTTSYLDFYACKNMASIAMVRKLLHHHGNPYLDLRAHIAMP